MAAANLAARLRGAVAFVHDAFERFELRPWMLALVLFVIIVVVVPAKLVAIPGYLVLWVACLFGSWYLLGGATDGP